MARTGARTCPSKPGSNRRPIDQLVQVDAGKLALGRPIKDQYVTYNGPAAAKIKREDWVGSGNAVAYWADGKNLSAFLGAGISEQPAPVTERYRAFLNALGGDGKGKNAFELGNPALRPERKAELAAGGSWKRDWWTLNAHLYYYSIDDFIFRTPVGTAQPLGLVVFGYRNINAQF